MLAALASPPPEHLEPKEAWSENTLGEDVVTLSYERALRAHARYQPSDRNSRRPEAASRLDEEPAQQISKSLNASDCDLRTASVTVRLSQAECASLHRRAAEAGLTVSAYLRSCTLEAEALRAQVKEALAGIRSTPSQAAKQPENENAGAADQRGAEVRLSRVIARVGKLCLGISNAKRA